MAGKKSGPNFVSEWYGHRVYPSVSTSTNALGDQGARRCPFLSSATSDVTPCVKSGAASGICTISASSNGPRQDWLVCPYRALDDALLFDATRRMFGLPAGGAMHVRAAPTLKRENTRARLARAIEAGEPCFVYLQDKLGGEVSLSPTATSPELSFDVTIVELKLVNGLPAVGRYAIFEIQTMDFHGSYREVVKNLEAAMHLHGDAFHAVLGQNQDWLSKDIEGPNMANVFKRTLYQAMFKFQIGSHAACAGAVLALPASVWDSWKRHLGGAPLDLQPDGTYSMRPGGPAPSRTWIYVFDVDTSTATSPSAITVSKVISTDADALAHYAFKVAPDAALAAGGSADRVLDAIRGRLAMWWPDLGPPRTPRVYPTRR